MKVDVLYSHKIPILRFSTNFHGLSDIRNHFSCHSVSFSAIENGLDPFTKIQRRKQLYASSDDTCSNVEVN